MQNERIQIRRSKPVMSVVYLRWRRICGENQPQPQLISRIRPSSERFAFKRVREI